MSVVNVSLVHPIRYRLKTWYIRRVAQVVSRKWRNTVSLPFSLARCSIDTVQCRSSSVPQLFVNKIKTKTNMASELGGVMHNQCRIRTRRFSSKPNPKEKQERKEKQKSFAEEVYHQKTRLSSKNQRQRTWKITSTVVLKSENVKTAEVKFCQEN